MMGIRKMIAVAVCLVVLVTAGIFINQETYASAVIVDINPSVRLELDDDEMVINYQALNEDAETLVLDDVIGMAVDDAISYITIQAIDAGFLDVEDLEDDYVLITTVSEKNQQEIHNMIKAAHEADENLRGLNLAMMIASSKDFEKFGDSDMPPGLLVASENMAERMTVKEYFRSQERVAEFEKNGEIFKQDFGKQIDRLNAHIALLDIDGDQKDAIMAEFLIAKVEFFEAKALLKEAISAYQLALKTGDEEAIAAAKQAMEEAENYKNEFEAQKDIIEDAKGLMMAAYDGEKDSDEIEQGFQDIIAKQVAHKAVQAEHKADIAAKKAAKDNGSSNAGRNGKGK